MGLFVKGEMKMKYQVFQDNEPADCFHQNNISRTWNNSIFDSFEEAIKYAIHWSYPYDSEEIEKVYNGYWKDKVIVNIPVNMSICEFPVMMEVREIVY